MFPPSYSVRVTSEDSFWRKLSPGRHYAIKREPLPDVTYYHHFIVVEHRDKSHVKVIHYAPPDKSHQMQVKWLKGVIREEQYLDEILKAIDKQKLYLIEKPDYSSENVDATLRRAKSKLGETQYSVEHNNCEHFVTWCKTGVHRSEQCSTASGFQRQFMRIVDSPRERFEIRKIMDSAATKLN